MKVTFILIFLVFIINLCGCKTNYISNNESLFSEDNKIPIILYTIDSTKEIKDTTMAVKIKYNIAAKKLETEPEHIFSFINGYYENYQWEQEDKLLFSSQSKIVYNSNNFTVAKDIPIKPPTKIYEINGTKYKLYGDNQGIVLQESSTDKNQNLSINLSKENTECFNFTPMTLSKIGNDIVILVHYYQPIKDNGMASGLYLVSISGENTEIYKIDLKGQCCINYEIEPVIIDDNIYVNTYGSIGYISISKKSFTIVPYFDAMKNEALLDLNIAKNTPDSFHYQPIIGKIGNLLLLSFGNGSNNYIWGIRSDKVIFRIKTLNGDIFDDNGNKIGTTNYEISRVLLPNW